MESSLGRWKSRFCRLKRNFYLWSCLCFLLNFIQTFLSFRSLSFKWSFLFSFLLLTVFFNFLYFYSFLKFSILLFFQFLEIFLLTYFYRRLKGFFSFFNSFFVSLIKLHKWFPFFDSVLHNFKLLSLLRHSIVFLYFFFNKFSILPLHCGINNSLSWHISTKHMIIGSYFFTSFCL